MTIALHPSERAARRRLRGPARRRAWYQAARIAAPIVAAIAGVVFATLTLFDWHTAAPTSRSFLSSAVILASTNPDPAALASPGDGTTGTAPLPPLPPALRGLSDARSTGVVPARPFAMRGAAVQDRTRALECLAAAIYYEAASESDEGQRAVAQVVLNRVRHPAFPATVCGVVYQGAERASGCQFSFACDGAMARVPAPAAWARATHTAAAALAGYVFAPVGLATHYHTYAVTPVWNRSLVMTDAIGAHFFHRWKGVWGTSAAFHQAYAGHEPIPGPPSRNVDPVPVIALNRAVAVAPPLAAASDVQPRPAENATPLPPPPSQDTLPESQILDRWKDSGTPLR